MRHGMYQNKVSDHKCGLRAICRHVNKKHQQTWVGWGLEMTITLWPLKFKCVIIWLLSRRERAFLAGFSRSSHTDCIHHILGD